MAHQAILGWLYEAFSAWIHARGGLVIFSGLRLRVRESKFQRADYAEGRTPEYWIVDPLAGTVAVLTLADDAYAEHGVFGEGDTATSVLLPGFSVDVTAVFDAAREWA